MKTKQDEQLVSLRTNLDLLRGQVNEVVWVARRCALERQLLDVQQRLAAALLLDQTDRTF